MRKLLYISLALTVFLTTLYLADQHNKKNTHPTLNEFAELPDRHLINSIEYYLRSEKDKSLESIEKAIEAVWIIEKDVEGIAAIKAEDVATKLERIHTLILEDSLGREMLFEVFSYSMNNLAYAEILVAQKYTNNLESLNAKKALRFAKSHLLNNNIFLSDELDSSLTIIIQIDNLLKKDSIFNSDYLNLLRELDSRNQKIKTNLNS
ncbi:hypothetical protein [Ekhidna sp. To15]|uniref:hypothetical protein n=1 Tax=Ekhidna sp. To15 TaxID=3395267 RepID=UPI003F52719E